MKKSMHFSKISLVLLLLSLLFIPSAWATHINGGFIAYKWVKSNIYEITIGIFHDAGGIPAASNTVLHIRGIDHQTRSVPLTSYRNIPIDRFVTGLALYTTEYTFPQVSFLGGIRYKLGVNIEMRNGGALNVPSPSDQIPFYIESEIYINSFTGTNNSPIPNDTLVNIVGKVNESFTMPLPSTDTDGDSLVYTIIPPLQNFAQPIEGYKSPEKVVSCTNCSFAIDSRTGQLVWDKPSQKGAYVFALKVEEWRRIPNSSQRIRIGYVIRDLQLVILD